MGQFTLDSYRTDSNMNKFLILSACLALATAAPGGHLLGAGLAGGIVPAGYAGLAGGAVVGTAVAPGPVAVHEQVHAGPAIAQHRTISGVVGHRQVQVGTQTVQVGHQYAQTGEVAHARAAYTEIAAPATNSASVRAIPAPPLPVPAAPAAIPPPAANYGPAPADAVTTYAVDAPVRTHTKITPRLHRIEPELQVNQVPYDVPVAVPVPVERTVVNTVHVPKPYEVPVPRAVPVAQPYKVHPVQQVVETPTIHKKTVTVQQPVVHTAVQQHVQTYAAPAVAVAAAPAAAVGVAAAPAAGVVWIHWSHRRRSHRCPGPCRSCHRCPSWSFGIQRSHRWRSPRCPSWRHRRCPSSCCWTLGF